MRFQNESGVDDGWPDRRTHLASDRPPKIQPLPSAGASWSEVGRWEPFCVSKSYGDTVCFQQTARGASVGILWTRCRDVRRLIVVADRSGRHARQLRGRDGGYWSQGDGQHDFAPLIGVSQQFLAKGCAQIRLRSSHAKSWCLRPDKEICPSSHTEVGREG